MKKRTKIFIILIVCLLAGSIVGTAIYAGDYYHAVDVAAYFTDNALVDVKEIKEGYLFNGPGEEDALIFYPGAKVEETAYAPLMRTLASQGVDCFLVKMPMRLAVMDSNKASRIRRHYPYHRYYLGGHSLGGAMAADHAASHAGDYSGLFLLAAYPSKDLSDAAFPVVFIYGDQDGVLNKKKLEEGFSLVPEDYRTVIIPGGNHAGFASYGAQKGDGTATVPPEEQQSITADTILEVIHQ